MSSTDLPSKPESICTAAWEGVFAASLGLTLGPVKCRQNVTRWRWPRSGTSWTGGYSYTVSPAVLLRCAQDGCLWCQLVAKLFPEKLRRSPWRLSVERRATVRVGKYDFPQFIRRSWCLFIGVDRYDHHIFKLFTTSDDPAAPWIDGRARIPHVADPRVLALALARIEECAREHAYCQAVTSHPIGSAPLPSRLIDCSYAMFPRLVETNSHSLREPYVALSYVWGMAQPHRTTKDNLASYINHGIDYAVLPQTIRDAIHVTRALGLRFLWIDSLCIIQDSQEDMLRELARMRDVYRYAYVTIDAACATNVTEGFLHKQRPLDPEHMLPFVCPRDPASQSIGQVQVGMAYIAPQNYEKVFPPSQDLITTADLPGNKTRPTTYTAARAWCLQEVLMSTRSLVFTSETVQLRCHTHTRNVGGCRHNPAWDLPRLPDATFLPDRQVVRGSDEWKHIRSRWRNVVEDYSNRLLSEPTDKLVAISGLAEMFAHALCTDYLAGLWRDSLIHDLLWRRCDWITQAPPPRYPFGYCAPSWSWGCIDGPTCYDTLVDRPDLHPLAEVVSCTVTLQNMNLPFGPVVSGSLILRARFFPCKWTDPNRFGVRQVAIEPIRGEPDRSIPGGSGELSSDEAAAETRLVAGITIDREEDVVFQRMWVIPLEHRDLVYVHGIVVTRAEPEVRLQKSFNDTQW
ncbi:HET-domain-containing protein [Cubamyces sp. BRFM 1775]|nr:HET-domain-containing protein [Cubamyces sp. BRFM 1775]